MSLLLPRRLKSKGYFQAPKMENWVNAAGPISVWKLWGSVVAWTHKYWVILSSTFASWLGLASRLTLTVSKVRETPTGNQTTHIDKGRLLCLFSPHTSGRVRQTHHRDGTTSLCVLRLRERKYLSIPAGGSILYKWWMAKSKNRESLTVSVSNKPLSMLCSVLVV